MAFLSLPLTTFKWQVYTYPIKSIRGIALDALPAAYTGFPHDRRFMLFDVKQGKNMHVSAHVEMCLLTTAFDNNETPNKVIVSYSKDHVFDQPDKKVSTEPLEVPLDPDVGALESFNITMHSSPVVGYDMGAKYNDWIGERLGYEVKLVYIGGNSRKVLGNMSPNVAGEQRSEKEAKGGSGSSWLGGIATTATSLLNTVMGTDRHEGVDEGISFADVAPYLVINTKSWESVNRRIGDRTEDYDIGKFRPNIIVEGAEEEFEEDYWAEVEFGNEGAKLILTQNCARCASLNVDYKTGNVAEGDYGKVLKKMQSDRRVDPGAKWSPVFGRYGFLARIPEGKQAPIIKVGDEVRVVRRNKERTRFGESSSSFVRLLKKVLTGVTNRMAQFEHLRTS